MNTRQPKISESASDLTDPTSIPQQPTDDAPAAELYIEKEDIAYPVVVIGGYADDPKYGAAFTITVDDPALSELDDYPLDPEPLDSDVKVSFEDADSGEKKTILLPYGVVVVFGQTRSGKSELLKYILKQTGGKFIRFMEAEAPAMTDPHRLSASIKRFFLDPQQKVFAVDSFRHSMFASRIKSAAGKGGVNTGIYGDLTALSIVAAQRKKILLVIVNPSTDDDLAEVMAKGIEGAISGIFVAQGYKRCRFVARTLDNLRTERKFAYSPDNQQTVKFGRGGLNALAFDTSSGQQNNFGSDAVAGKIGKAILRTYSADLNSANHLTNN